MNNLRHYKRLCKVVHYASYNTLEYLGKTTHKPPFIPANISKPQYVKKETSEKYFISSFFKSVTKRQIKNENEISKMKESCSLGRKILDLVGSEVKVGITTNELDKIARELIFQHEAYPSPLGYKGFPKSICTSVNNVVVHGIPDDRKLENGDIINVDLTVFINGFHGDLSEMYCVGEVDEDGKDLIKVTYTCLNEAIKICKHGEKFSKIGAIISEIATSNGYSVCPYFVGHGIGDEFHEAPQILHHHNYATGLMLDGMIFTIEPVLCEGSSEIVHWDDNWTVVTADSKRSAQVEHTILIRKDGAEILTC